MQAATAWTFLGPRATGGKVWSSWPSDQRLASNPSCKRFVSLPRSAHRVTLPFDQGRGRQQAGSNAVLQEVRVLSLFCSLASVL